MDDISKPMAFGQGQGFGQMPSRGALMSMPSQQRGMFRQQAYGDSINRMQGEAPQSNSYQQQMAQALMQMPGSSGGQAPQGAAPQGAGMPGMFGFKQSPMPSAPLNPYFYPIGGM